jgi:hypothetical protein
MAQAFNENCFETWVNFPSTRDSTFLSSGIGIIEGFSTRDIIASEEIMFCYGAGLKYLTRHGHHQ